ncbi:hypothetical protein V1477_011093 [Vespula maculifrons]|uniref:Uncharacterized protein n=1 Tax=Vespula maculifrons TaxID=7453 RepID=A0ABD2C3U3_VESMC
MTEKVQTDVGFRIFKGNGMLGDVVVTFDSVLPARLAQSARFAGLFSQGRSIMPLQTPCICSVNVNGRGWHSLTGVACPLARELELPEAFLASTLRTTLTSLLCPVPWLMVGAGNIKSPRLPKRAIEKTSSGTRRLLFLLELKISAERDPREQSLGGS